METLIQVVATSAVTSSLFVILNSYFERKATRQEVLFNRAFELAAARERLAMTIADREGRNVQLRDHVFVAQEYYVWLKHLYDHGVLPSGAHEAESRSQA
jgi:hypothetical protein